MNDSVTDKHFISILAFVPFLLYVDIVYMYVFMLGLKNWCVSANMPKKIRDGRLENLFIFLQIFIS